VADYYRLAADHGSLDGQLHYAECLLAGYGVEMNIKEAKKYFIAASKSHESDRGCLQYGIALVCGRLNRFNFAKALDQFSRIAKSNRLARRFVDSLAESANLVSAKSASEIGTFFGIFSSQIHRTSADSIDES
jgi:TPR repeat protein